MSARRLLRRRAARKDIERGDGAWRPPARSRVPRALVVAHWSLAEPAVGAAKGTLGECHVDLLAYGSGAPAVASEALGDFLSLPKLDGGPLALAGSALGFWRSIRRHRYEAAVVAQPGLRRSRARGVLLSFPFVTRHERVLALESTEQRLMAVSPAEAFVDLGRWVFVQACCTALAMLAAPLLRAIGKRASTPRPPGMAGRVLYLRTDLDLAGSRLAAGGSLAHTLGIVDALRHRGHEVEVWSTGDIDGLASDVRTRSIPALVRANWPTEVAELVSGLRQGLAGLRRKPAGAFVYQRYSLNSLCGLMLARRWKVPLILEANASEVQWREEWSSLRYRRLSAACERLLLRSADRVLVVSANAERHLLAAGADPARLRVVPNGVDVDRFAHAVPYDLGFPSDAFVIAFCGLFYRWHGVATLAEAFARLRERHRQARLLLIGQGEEETRVKAILRAAGVLEDCMLPGLVAREQVPSYLAAADVLVSPHADLHNFIGSPIKVFEYMASGRPIVASRVAQLAEILTDGETALLVQPGDSIALASALERLIDDPELRQRLGAIAQREARARHSWDSRLESILSEERADSRAGPSSVADDVRIGQP